MICWRHAWLLPVLLLTGCDRPLPEPAEQTLRPVQVQRVAPRPITVSRDFVGRLQAAQTVDLAFEVDGELTSLPILEGQAVAAGDLLAALDPTRFELALQEASIDLRLTRLELERRQTLLAERATSVAEVDAARARFELAEVRLARARESLHDSRITAPFDAVVARRHLDIGTRVRVGDVVARLANVSELRVVASLPEDLLASLAADAWASIRVSAAFRGLPSQRFDLQYVEHAAEANAVAQTFDVTFSLPRPEGAHLLPGMTAVVYVDTRSPRQAAEAAEFMLPTAALLSAPDGSFMVWVLDPESGRVQRRGVTVTEARGSMGTVATGIGIGSGLAEGEWVVVAGASQLQDGMRVRPVDADGRGL